MGLGLLEEGLLRNAVMGMSRGKCEMSCLYPLTSTSFSLVQSLGRTWASVLKIQCSNGSRSSSENIKYKYLEGET